VNAQRSRISFVAPKQRVTFKCAETKLAQLQIVKNRRNNEILYLVKNYYI